VQIIFVKIAAILISQLYKHHMLVTHANTLYVCTYVYAQNMNFEGDYTYVNKMT